MKTEVKINSNILTWAIARAGFDLVDFTNRVPNVRKWIDGEKNPTVSQLKNFSKKVYIPFGYLFLDEHPKEEIPIPFFRTDNNNTKLSINTYDTILLLQRRQDWLKNYLLDGDAEELPFVGKFKDSKDVYNIVKDIRKILGLKECWAGEFKTWQDALNHLTEQIEECGIITVFNGVVGNNTKRKIPVDECRGFVLVDKIAPFLFINNSDSKAAQMFTLVHELAHIWTGHSAGFDFRTLMPADDPVERICDKVAAEFLVSEQIFNEMWDKNPDIKKSAKFFKVSELVIARRALDAGKINKKQFFDFYDEYSDKYFRRKKDRSTGGDFYATTRKRLSITFASHINNAVKSGSLLYRDACKLTGLKGDTFQYFLTKYI